MIFLFTFLTFSKQIAGLEKKSYSLEWPANKDEREERPNITVSWTGTKLGPQTCFVNKQLTLFFNFLQNASLNFAQNFRECLFKLAGSESGEKSKRAKIFVYISQLFVYKTRLWT